MIRTIAAQVFPWFCLLAGCGQTSPSSPGESVTPAGYVASGNASQETLEQPPRRSSPKETWQSVYLQRSKVGYVQMRVQPVQEPGRQLVEVSSETRLSIRRGDHATELAFDLLAYETRAGDLLRFKSDEPSTGRLVGGRVDGNQLLLEITTRGKTERQRVPWQAQTKGFWHEYLSLREAPLLPGQRRTFQKLEPIFYQVASVEMQAKGYEAVALPSGTQQLLRIAVTTSLVPGAVTWFWTNHEGEVLKSETDVPIETTTYRTDREQALAEDAQATLDFALASFVPVDREIPRPHETLEVVYELTLEDQDPAGLLPKGLTQQFQAQQDHALRLRVDALRPESPAQEPPPSEEFRQANALLQSDAPLIQKLTAEAIGDVTEPAELAPRLEKWVHEYLIEKNLRVAFATALDVAQHRQGDCTEFAVLLAAMARAAKIPSRLAVGLVVVEGRKQFGYHAWTELYVNGKWIPYDATLGRGHVGAAHIKLAHSSLHGGNSLSVLLPVARVLKRIRLKVLQYRHQ